MKEEIKGTWFRSQLYAPRGHSTSKITKIHSMVNLMCPNSVSWTKYNEVNY